ncbi:hypothetical protein Taro_056984 [Colocasia esculenta]|uniref:Uncharacterized protein n=1 Tax=Colocasia esculenta TaxID=4460 RepID=A0A843XVB3_COLES|nr:hypothetical protein [Colocasia esculenta]
MTYKDLSGHVSVRADDGADVAKAVDDFRGNPADKATTGGWLSAGLILGALPFKYYLLSSTYARIGVCVNR